MAAVTSPRVWRIASWLAVIALILSIPLIAMVFTREVNWTPFDFGFAASLLLIVAVVYEIAARSGSIFYRAGVAAALAAGLLLIWINGAVGIIGDESNRANLLFLGVLAIALMGAFIGRFRSNGMARATCAAAFAQVLVGTIALIAGWGANGPSYPWDIVGLSGFFSALWLASAWLFRKSQTPSPING